MAPITPTTTRVANNDIFSGIRDTTHALVHAPFRHLSVWAYIALGIVLLAVTFVMGYAVYSCYRSAAVDVEAVEARARGDNYTEGRMSPRVGGRGKTQADRMRRRGIVTFSEKAKAIGRPTKELSAHTPQRPQQPQEKLSKSPPRPITNPDTSIRSQSSAYSSSEYDGDGYTLDSPSMAAPPPVYVNSPHRESRVRRGIRSSSCPKNLKSLKSPSTLSALISMTPTTASMAPSKHMTPKISKTSKGHRRAHDLPMMTPMMTPLIPFTPSLPAAATVRPSGIKYDSHHIRFVLPREKSTESLETARFWRDPKLSPVGGNIIHPFPSPLLPAGISMDVHVPNVSFSGKNQKKNNKGGSRIGAALGRETTEKAKGRR